MARGRRTYHYLTLGLYTTAVVYLLHWLLLTLSSEPRKRLTSTVVALNDGSTKMYDFDLSRNTAVDFTTEAPEYRSVSKSGRYVSMSHGWALGAQRTGNNLFHFAAVLHVARLTGRRAAIERYYESGWLDRWFYVPITRVNNVNADLCPCYQVEALAGLSQYLPMSELLNRTDIAGKSILLSGYFQSWKYTVGVESTLRYHLRLLPQVTVAIHKYLDQIRPRDWNNFIRIGIHVRVGDIAGMSALKAGFTVPQRPYFEQAMSRFVSQRRHIQFIVASDDIPWVKRAINFTAIVYQLKASSTKNEVLIDLVYSEGHDAGFDLGLLSLCDGVIITGGTYGWWGAWLANKTTIYYSGWPRPGSRIDKELDRDNFYPPNWIPVGGPAFSWTSYNSDY